MREAIGFLDPFIRPASIGFFVVVLGVGTTLAFVRKTHGLARWYFAAVFIAYWMLTTPACVERTIAWTSGSYRPLAAAAEARDARMVVVLAAGNQTIRAGGLSVNFVSWVSALRVLEGARLYRLLNGPTIVLSGGATGTEEGSAAESESMQTAALQLGIPPEKIVLERESRNTRQEAQAIRRMLADRPSTPIVLVTSPTHMRRAMATFRAVGLNPIASPSAYKSEHSLERRRWLPNDLGLWLQTAVAYDIVAMWYYRAQGWIQE
jgi:uncharacterized SAM-binding protein YcdF (DUF218 family)